MARQTRRRPTKKRVTQAARVVEALKRTYPDAQCSLTYADPLQLLVATILSAQCTDARVNKVTPGLFARYKDAEAFAEAQPDQLEEEIRTTGFYRNKARSIREACQDIVTVYEGKVPQTLDELTGLRGVGRKTANVVLGNAYGVPGMVVDTHVGRLSRRLGLTKENDPAKVERDLMEIVPAEEWVDLGHRMIQHGRNHCKARSPDCGDCPLEQICPSKMKEKNKADARGS